MTKLGMEDPGSPYTGNHSQNSGAAMEPSKLAEDAAQRIQYSIPGILHFIQHEWARFEMERAQWSVERSELQARIAFLQGERKGQDNLKHDLVRRIKMLEYALKQERGKYHKLKYGSDQSPSDIKPPSEDNDDILDGESFITPVSNVSWRQGRQLLRQYLQEIGYMDNIIDVRSQRVRTLLGLSKRSDIDENQPLVNGEHPIKRTNDAQQSRRPAKKGISLAENTLLDSEASVLATFDFLQTANADDDDDDDDDDENDVIDGLNDLDVEERLERRLKLEKLTNDSGMNVDDDDDDEDVEESEIEEACAEFDFLTKEEGTEQRNQPDGMDWEKRGVTSTNEEWGVSPSYISKLTEQYKNERKGKKGAGQRVKRTSIQTMLATLGDEEENIAALQLGSSGANSSSKVNNFNDLDDTAVRGEVGIAFTGAPRRTLGMLDDNLESLAQLGELADLTVTNEADAALTYDIPATKDDFRKTWNAKYTLRSHFDGVRALAFHPVEPVLVTASEDHTLKLWNLQKTVPAKKAASLDVEPVYTFRGHIGPVLSLVVDSTGEECYSGGQDGTVICWKIPNSNVDPYDSYEPSVLKCRLQEHSDAVWGLSMHRSKPNILSCSADGSVKLWDPTSASPLLQTYTSNEADGLPTSVDFIHCDGNQIVVSYRSSNAILYDLETAKQILTYDTKKANSTAAAESQINCVISHPTLPMMITAQEDRNIRFFDNNTGKVVHSMVAHLDAVTTLAVDPNGLYLLSGSHDCSIRLWNLDSKTCVQEITSHRKKFDESIYDVAFHPSKPYIASAGADALAKVFV